MDGEIVMFGGGGAGGSGRPRVFLLFDVDIMNEDNLTPLGASDSLAGAQALAMSDDTDYELYWGPVPEKRAKSWPRMRHIGSWWGENREAFHAYLVIEQVVQQGG